MHLLAYVQKGGFKTKYSRLTLHTTAPVKGYFVILSGLTRQWLT